MVLKGKFARGGGAEARVCRGGGGGSPFYDKEFLKLFLRVKTR